MSRSPIEVAIDEACGFSGIPDEEKPKPPYNAPEEYVAAYQSVVDAAMRWHGHPGVGANLVALRAACDRLMELEGDR